MEDLKRRTMWRSDSLFIFVLVLCASCAVIRVACFPCPGSIGPIDSAEVYKQVTPKGNISAGRFVKVQKVNKLPACVRECCATRFCHVVFMYQTTCFLIQCASDDLCEPVHRRGKKFRDAVMVRVRSIPEDDLLSNHPFGNTYYDDDDMNNLFRAEKFMEYFNEDATDSSSISGASEVHRVVETRSKACEVGIVTDCLLHEECVPKNSRSRQGFCFCQGNYTRDAETGRCKLQSGSTAFTTMVTNTYGSATTKISALATTGVSTSSPTVVPEVKHLVVSAGENKILQLPENEVALSAYALPEQQSEQYRYEWTLVAHPEGDYTGTMGDKNLQTLKLTSLKEGLYTLKVSVSGKSEYGEAYVNVTVLPPKRINKPPVAIINPVNQTVKLPNTNTVLDGSASTDDDKIVSYHWEQVSAPINYQPDLTDKATLQLENLVPGFYRFMLTVKDSDGSVNSTYANISVIKETDYPPTANAGTDVIIYLPQNEVVLNGNLSTDDKGIKSWEWTKGPDTNKAVDMQNTRTPYVRLSNLEIGMYTFVLKVTDTSDQSATADVRVFVKKENNEAPVADAGANQEIVLPQESVILDGSRSRDDLGIKSWEWKQLSGPNNAKLDTPNQAKTNATGLTKGVYVFQLTVTDEKKLSNSTTMTVTVKQTENQSPKANAGGDKTVQLPVDIVVLNGSSSSDDLGIVSYEWTRDPTSLAAGVIVEKSENTSALKLMNLIPGRYLFRLKVTDNQGASSTDTASLIVKTDVHEKDNVEMQINADIFWFTEEQKVTLEQKLALLLHDEGEVRVHIKSISAAHGSERVVLVFVVERMVGSNVVSVEHGVDVVYALKRKLQTDSSLLDYDVMSIDTVVCQNNCSSHGSCDASTKRCICEAFWMEDVFRYHFRDKESNCDWSILYVIIILFTIVVTVCGLIWAFVCLCRRMRFRRPRKRHRYTLLENGIEREGLSLVPKGKGQMSSLMVSDSDLESDTVFEQNQVNGKANGHHYTKQSAHGPNGLVQHARKVKT